MQVQINLNAPFEYKAGQKIKPFDFCGDIVLATDPGKTNMAMAVGTPFGTQLCILQFRAPGSAYDTSDYPLLPHRHRSVAADGGQEHHQQRCQPA